ncbi:hypothetical protein RF11_16377 [Thelohanellus kitauei]|uniref:Uncharacterized protein n=1 Tax=Thelohanellus kitauei TaxID=669202 RepID=A0A0C2IE53_THEKT|nr:hypothetical protein RF11_16377 [Thelohanellus kitauei]
MDVKIEQVTNFKISEHQILVIQTTVFYINYIFTPINGSVSMIGVGKFTHNTTYFSSLLKKKTRKTTDDGRFWDTVKDKHLNVEKDQPLHVNFSLHGSQTIPDHFEWVDIQYEKYEDNLQPIPTIDGGHSWNPMPKSESHVIILNYETVILSIVHDLSAVNYSLDHGHTWLSYELFPQKSTLLHIGKISEADHKILIITRDSDAEELRFDLLDFSNIFSSLVPRQRIRIKLDGGHFYKQQPVEIVLTRKADLNHPIAYNYSQKHRYNYLVKHITRFQLDNELIEVFYFRNDTIVSMVYDPISHGLIFINDRKQLKILSLSTNYEYGVSDGITVFLLTTAHVLTVQKFFTHPEDLQVSFIYYKPLSEISDVSDFVDYDDHLYFLVKGQLMYRDLKFNHLHVFLIKNFTFLRLELDRESFAIPQCAGFRCNNSNCLLDNVRFNGANDRGHYSDEVNCKSIAVLKQINVLTTPIFVEINALSRTLFVNTNFI